MLAPQAILYSFPAICWLYGAGIIFSSFASVVFWGQPIARLWQILKTSFTTVVPVGMQVGFPFLLLYAICQILFFFYLLLYFHVTLFLHTVFFVSLPLAVLVCLLVICYGDATYANPELGT